MQVNYSVLSQAVNNINNPNRALGTLIEEIPADIGRSYEGYKRGGILEGAEKMRKELMSAVVWMFGIPAFNKLGNLFCEKILKIPMNIDYSKDGAGNDAIKDTIEYIKSGVAKDGLDISEVQHYREFKNNKTCAAILQTIEKSGVDNMVKKVVCAKKITSAAAVIINCLMMGIVLPKFNQALTAKKLEENKKKEQTLLKPVSMEDFKNKTKTPSFKGKLSDFDFTYATENNNTFRLVITDIPMIIGRCATSRNKYEALEYVIMDGGSIFFYNFCSGIVQKALRKAANTPNINPVTAEILAQADKEKIESAYKIIESLPKGNKKASSHIDLQTLLQDKELADMIYKEATYGKYGKINRFVKYDTLKEIDDSVINFLSRLKEISSDANPLFKDGKLNRALIGKINKSNAGYLAAGLITSIIGLAIIIPKLTFYITKKITGKNVFTGIEHYDDDKKNEKKPAL